MQLWHHINVERTVYGTVVLMSVLVVYEGWASLTTFFGTALVIIAPMVALLLAHYFADLMSLHVEVGRPLHRAEWRGLVGRQVGILMSAVQPLILVLIGWLTPLDAVSTIRVVLWGGVASLVFLASISARRAGYTGWRLVVASAMGGLLGLVVISMQVLLKPH
jgi:hypothetical protein